MGDGWRCRERRSNGCQSALSSLVSIERGFMGIASPCACIFPSGTCLAMNSDVLLSLHALVMSMLHGRLFAAGLFHGYHYVQLRRKDMFGKVRKTRSDCTVGTYEKKHDLPTGTLRNSDGRKARKDKTLKSLRKETGSDYR